MRKIALMLVFILLCVTPAFAATINITDIGDTYVFTPNGNWTNNGARAILTVGNLSNTVYRTYYLFNTSTIPINATIDSATFYVYENLAGSSIDCYNTSAMNTSGASYWNEGTLVGGNCSSRCNLDQNMTWTTAPAAGTLQSNATPSGPNAWVSFTVTNAIASAYSASKPASLMLKNSNEALANSKTQPFAKEQGTNAPYVSVTYHMADCAADCGACGCNADGTGCYVPTAGGAPITTSATYCDPVEAALYGNTTKIDTVTASCGYSYYNCPSGTTCTQITPVSLSTNGLVTESITCEACWFRSDFYYFNSSWLVMATNCPNNPECNNCDYPSFPSIGNTEWRPVGAVCQGHNLIATNISSVPASASYYTAGCVNAAGRVIDVIDQNGNHTNITALTQQIWNTTDYNYTFQCPTNTTTACYVLPDCVRVYCNGQQSCNKTNQTGSCWDKFCNPAACVVPPASTTSTSFMGILALGMGSAFGITDLAASEWIFSMVIALAVGLFIVFFTRTGLHFAIGMLGTLIMFTLIGWFPGWVMIMLIVISAYLVARQMGVIGE